MHKEHITRKLLTGADEQSRLYEWQIITNHTSKLVLKLYSINQSINQSIQFWFRLIPVNGDGRIYPALTEISLTSTFHLARFMASSFSKPTLLLSFSSLVILTSSCPSLQTPMLFWWIPWCPATTLAFKAKVVMPSKKGSSRPCLPKPLTL